MIDYGPPTVPDFPFPDIPYKRAFLATVLPTIDGDAAFDATCQRYYGRLLADHARIRRRFLSVLPEMDWDWKLVGVHCGLPETFLEEVIDTLLERYAS